MIYENLSEHDYLLRETSILFPNAPISVEYPADEIINITVDDARYVFEIGSDDDEYIFHSALGSFVIPLMPE